MAPVILLLWVALAQPPAQARDREPPVVRDGRLMRAGKPYRAIGINVVSLADDILARGEAASQNFAAIRRLGEKKVPFIRFWASYFDNRRPHRDDPKTYWRHMDLLVAACEKAEIGLVPTLFWNVWNVPFDFGEFRYAWMDEESQTRAYMRRYVQEFVKRYRGRRAVWIWEFANESNLSWDLPNSIALLPEARRDNRNIVRFYTGIAAARAFGREVRRHDRKRPISSGDSSPRPSQHRISTVPLKPGEPWGQDAPEQASEAAGWTAPAPIDLLSVHYYALPGAYDPAAVRADLRTRQQWAARFRRPLFLGEFGVIDRWTRVPDGFDDDAYRRSLRDLFEAVYETGVPLAAYWAYSPQPNHNVGAVSPADTRFEYVLDLIAEYNGRFAAQ